MTSNSQLHEGLATIQQATGHFVPQWGIILGSGLGDIAELLQSPKIINYEKIPGFPQLNVQGHHGQLSFGTIGSAPVVCIQGRPHRYETNSYDGIITLIRTLKLLGCHSLIFVSACGSLNPEIGPGNIVLVNDHINFHPGNPVVGINDDEFGPRFFPLNDAYSETLRQQFHECGAIHNMTMTEGVYISVLGPCYETPAEIRAYRQWGADVIGMSTVPEVIVARHCGMDVAVLSVITNLGAGLSDTPPNHEEVVEQGKQSKQKITTLLREFFRLQSHSTDQP